jgi:hypothetical protein
MKAFGLTRSHLLTFLLLAGCTGLDPQPFGSQQRAARGGQAGYSFDAGLGGTAPADAGRAAASGGRDAGSGGTGVSGQVGEHGGGEGGAELQAEGGAPSEPEPTTGDAGRTTAGRSGVASGGRAGSASSAGGRSGAAGRGGLGGAASAGGDRQDAGASGVAGAGAPARGGGGAAAPAEHALVFSEYVEGSGSYKALELVAGAASTLDGCRLVTYSNGSLTGASITLSGPVAQGAVYTLCSTTLAALLGEVCDRTTNLSFNGDDAVALECEGETIDVIGQIGVDPGTAWTGPSGSTVNGTLRRRCDLFAADPDGTDPFDPDLAFTPHPVDTFDGLGDPACG